MSPPTLLLDLARNPWASVCGTILAGATAAQFSNNAPAHSYYASLAKPPGNPPRWALGPIWGTLYGLLGYAAHRLALLSDSPTLAGAAGAALELHYAQLALNFLYMPVFFTVQSREAALVVIVAITGMTCKLVDDTRGLPGPTYLFLLPYAAWMIYSTYLNVGLIYLNPSSKGKAA